MTYSQGVLSREHATNLRGVAPNKQRTKTN